MSKVEPSYSGFGPHPPLFNYEQFEDLYAEIIEDGKRLPSSYYLANSILDRSQAILQPIDLKTVIERVQAIESVFVYWSSPDMWPEDAQEEYEYSLLARQEDNLSLAAELYARKEESVVLNLLGDPRPNWGNYFASLAIYNLIRGIDNYKRGEQFDSITRVSSALIAYAEHLTQAMECIAFAERFSTTPHSIEDYVERAISHRNSQAAKARHAKVTELKSDFINFYTSGKFKSKADAARRFLSSLPNGRRRLLSKDNAVRTLTQALKP